MKQRFCPAGTISERRTEEKEECPECGLEFRCVVNWPQRSELYSGGNDVACAGAGAVLIEQCHQLTDD